MHVKLCVLFVHPPDVAVCLYRDVANTIIESKQWPLALCGRSYDEGNDTTPFRQLIVKMPGNS